MELSRLNAQFAVMEEENGTLFKMQDEQFEGNASFVPVHIIIRRLDANKILQTQLSAHIAGETRDLLKVSRMLDILNNRLSAFERASLRTEEAMEIDEHVGHLLAKHAI
ncbi:hypothetical protein [Phyllobacterium brassicacearum]|nr:hypothetical protein [Phyllobacterium brassicacearum]